MVLPALMVFPKYATMDELNLHFQLEQSLNQEGHLL